MITYNYTSVTRRESKTYAFDNIKISSTGITGGMMKTIAMVFGVFSIFGVIFCVVKGKIYYIPIVFGAGLKESAIFVLIFVVIPIFLGISIKNVKIQNYDLVTFLYL